MSRQGALVKNTAILSLGTVVPKLVNIVALPILTGYLSKADYGTYDLVVSLVSLLLPVATLQLQASAFRFLIEARSDEPRQKGIVISITVASSVVSVLVLTILFFLLTDVDVYSRILVCAYYLLDILVITFRQVARGLSRNGVYSISVIVNSFSEGLAIVGFVMLLGYGLKGALLASLIGQAVSLAVLFFGARIYQLLDVSCMSLSLTRELVAYSWPLIPNSLSSWIISTSDRLVLTLMIGIEASAIYAAASKIPHILNIFQTAFNLAWQENASLSKLNSDRDAYYSAMFDGVFCLLAGGLALLIAASPILFHLLIRGDYEESYAPMNILFFGAFAAAMSSFLGGIYIAHMKTREIGATTTVAAVCNLAVKMIFVPTAGICAASIAYAASFSFLALYRAFRISLFQPIEFNRGKIAITCLLLIGMTVAGASRVLYLEVANALLGAVMFIVLNRTLIQSCVRRLHAGRRA